MCERQYGKDLPNNQRRNMIVKRRIYRKTEAVLRLIFHRQGEGQHFVVSICIAFRCVREM